MGSPEFESTQFDSRSSLPDHEDGGIVISTYCPSLSSSMLADLTRFSNEPTGTELLVIIAAGVRHAHSIAMHLQLGKKDLRLSVYPREQLFRCETDVCELRPVELAQLRCVHVEPETLVAPAGSGAVEVSPDSFHALGPLLWQLALHGPHSELLPEIAGRVKYRLSRGVSLNGLPVENTMRSVLNRMGRESFSLNELAGWAVLGRPRIRRLLNALYLQSGLMITRGFPT